jgi:hypothetical protein
MLSTLMVCVLLISAPATASTLVGRWRTLEISKGGIGAMVEFYKDGRVDYSVGAVVEMSYQIDADTLILPPETTGGAHQKQRFSFPAPGRVSLRADDSPSVELTRVGTPPQTDHPLVGEWVGSREVGSRTMSLRYIFYPGGKLLLLIPFVTEHGTYSLDHSQIRLTLPNRQPITGTWRVEGDLLTMPSAGGVGDAKFRRY